MARLAFLPTDIWPTLAKVNKSHENHQIDLCSSSYCSIFEFADFSKPNGKWCHRPLLNWLILSLSLFLSLISSFTLTLNRKFYHAWAPEKPCILQVFLPAFCLQIQRKKHELSSPCHSEGPKANYLRSLAIFFMPSSESWTLLLDSHIEYYCNCYYYHCLLIRFIVITSTISIIIIVIVLSRIPILYYHYIYYHDSYYPTTSISSCDS